MFASTLDFVSKALLSAVECSITDLRTLDELSGIGALEAVRKLEGICAVAHIECHPPLSCGELDDTRVFTARRTKDQAQDDLERALKAGEGHQVEFKQTLGLHLKRRENDPNATPDQLFAPEIVHEVIKTIISFLNADGGTLVIGVCDDGALFGIENEFAYIGGGKNLDTWALKLNAALEAHIPDFRQIAGYISQAVIEQSDHIICVIKVEARRDRICVCRRSNKEGEDEIVYRRSGNSTLRLQPRDVEALVFDRIRQGQT